MGSQWCSCQSVELCWPAIVACSIPTHVWQGVGLGWCSLATCRPPHVGTPIVALQFALKLEKFPERKSVLHETKVRDQWGASSSARAVLMPLGPCVALLQQLHQQQHLQGSCAGTAACYRSAYATSPSTQHPRNVHISRGQDHGLESRVPCQSVATCSDSMRSVTRGLPLYMLQSYVAAAAA